MGLKRLAVVVACVALFVGCGGIGASAPSDASVEDFCAAKDWFVAEGLDRLSSGDFPPPQDALAELAQDWAEEYARVGTPENISPDARLGFERFLDRLDDIDGGDVETMRFNWEEGAWENAEEKAFGQYMTNTCS